MNEQTQTQKWASEAGPIQTNKVNAVLRAIQGERTARTQLSGVIGVSESKCSMCSPFSPTTREDYAPAWLALGERFGWKVTRENYQQIIEAGLETAKQLAENRPVDDMRRTPEQEAAEVAAREKAHTEREEAERVRVAGFLAEYASGKDAHVPEGQMVVLAEMCYDNSDMMSDYHNPHCPIGPELLVMITRKQAWTERLAREAVSLIPMFRGLEWTWVDEYAGKKLIARGIKIPEGANCGRVRQGQPVEIGHWVIDASKRGRSSDQKTIKGYGEMPAVAVGFSGESTSSGGVTVRRNLEHDGVEIKFPGKPAADVIARCKEAGFRWSRFSQVWYKRYGAYAWAQAHTIAGLPVPEPPATTQSGPDHFDMAVEDRMAEACGL